MERRGYSPVSHGIRPKLLLTQHSFSFGAKENFERVQFRCFFPPRAERIEILRRATGKKHHFLTLIPRRTTVSQSHLKFGRSTERASSQFGSSVREQFQVKIFLGERFLRTQAASKLARPGKCDEKNGMQECQSALVGQTVNYTVQSHFEWHSLTNPRGIHPLFIGDKHAKNGMPMRFPPNRHLGRPRDYSKTSFHLYLYLRSLTFSLVMVWRQSGPHRDKIRLKTGKEGRESTITGEKKKHISLICTSWN